MIQDSSIPSHSERISRPNRSSLANLHWSEVASPDGNGNELRFTSSISSDTVCDQSAASANFVDSTADIILTRDQPAVARQILVAKRSMGKFLAVGARFVKHCRKGKPYLAYVVVATVADRPCLTWSSSSNMCIEDILKISLGKQTRVLCRRSARVAPATRCFSLVCDKKTLDLEAMSEEQCIRWVEALVVCFDLSVDIA